MYLWNKVKWDYHRELFVQTKRTCKVRVNATEQFSLVGPRCMDGCGLIGQGRARSVFMTWDNTDTLQLTGFPYEPHLDEVGPPRQIRNKKKMTSLDPLKTVISIGNVDDTSLALPSVNQFRSGQQRVLEQVQTVRRTKSRQSSSRSGSTSLSPTSKSSL